MSGGIKPCPVPSQGCSQGSLQQGGELWGWVMAGPHLWSLHSAVTPSRLHPGQLSSASALLALAERSLVTSTGLWTWQHLDSTLSVCPSDSWTLLFGFGCGGTLLGFFPGDLLVFSGKPVSTSHDL